MWAHLFERKFSATASISGEIDEAESTFAQEFYDLDIPSIEFDFG